MVTDKRRVLARLLVLFLFSVIANSALSAGGNYEVAETDNLNPVRKLLQKKDYQGAIDKLEVMREEEAKNPDILNLLGFSHRKLGDYDVAYEFYQQALTLDPKHKGANEYLGQLYLETDRLELAKERLSVLKEICKLGCSERRSLNKAIKRYEKSH